MAVVRAFETFSFSSPLGVPPCRGASCIFFLSLLQTTARKIDFVLTPPPALPPGDDGVFREKRGREKFRATLSRESFVRPVVLPCELARALKRNRKLADLCMAGTRRCLSTVGRYVVRVDVETMTFRSHSAASTPEDTLHPAGSSIFPRYATLIRYSLFPANTSVWRPERTPLRYYPILSVTGDFSEMWLNYWQRGVLCKNWPMWKKIPLLLLATKIIANGNLRWHELAVLYRECCIRWSLYSSFKIARENRFSFLLFFLFSFFQASDPFYIETSAREPTAVRIRVNIYRALQI